MAVAGQLNFVFALTVEAVNAYTDRNRELVETERG
jgi:hypothetical protein